MAEDKEKPDKVASNTEPTAEETVTKKTAKKETQYAEFEEFTDDLTLSDGGIIDHICSFTQTSGYIISVWQTGFGAALRFYHVIIR